MDISGQLIWNELRTTNIDAALAFYHDLFGWSTNPEEAETYVHLYMEEDVVAGVSSSDAEAGEKPNWQIHVATDDIEAFCTRAKAGGGSLNSEVLDNPDIGKLAIVADPEGALIVGFQVKNTKLPTWKSSQEPGHFCWAELVCRDGERAKKFYSEVAGWQTVELPMGEMGSYTIFNAGETGVAGLMPLPKDVEATASWLPYVAVANVSEKTVQSLDLGAEVVVPPTAIPGIGLFSVLRDPQGASFALFGKLDR